MSGQERFYAIISNHGFEDDFNLNCLNNFFFSFNILFFSILLLFTFDLTFMHHFIKLTYSDGFTCSLTEKPFVWFAQTIFKNIFFNCPTTNGCEERSIACCCKKPGKV